MRIQVEHGLGQLQVVSTVLFLALMGGAAFLWLKLSGKDDDGNDDDALAEAKRIMNKYR
jgi:nitrogen fixation-related uncharacterized protein